MRASTDAYAARVVSMKAAVPNGTPADTVNRLCGIRIGNHSERQRAKFWTQVSNELKHRGVTGVLEPLGASGSLIPVCRRAPVAGNAAVSPAGHH
jgi:hypothetical protein